MRIVSRISFMLLALSFAADLTLIPVVGAQTNATIACDSDLILNLYVAQRFFGFNEVQTHLTESGMDTSTMVDLNTFDRGQFAPLFDEFMGTTGTDTSSTTINQDSINGISEFLMADDAGRQTMMQESMPSGTDTSAFTSMVPLAVEGEAAECAQLRSELTNFFTAVAFQDARSGFSMNQNSNTDMNGATQNQVGGDSNNEAQAGGTTDMTATPSS